MEKIHDFVYSAEVLEFVRSCKSFVDILEEDTPEVRADFVIRLLQLLPSVYSGLMKLPPNEPVLDQESEKTVSEEQWSQIYQKVAVLMSSQNEYLDLPEDDEFDRMDVISRELSEDLADIYQDLKDFLEVFKIGTEEVMNDVMWECRVNFENYWGEKLLRASLNLHKIMIQDEEILEKMDREFEEKSTRREYKADDWFLTRRQNEAGKKGGIPE
jgi:hypothetical protein